MHTRSNEKGAAALFIASALVLLFGIAAIAIDVGAGFNERRQNQTVADVAVMAGVVEYALASAGQNVSLESIRDSVLDYAEVNLTSSYTPQEYAAMWNSCTDPNKNAGGFNFQPLPAPTGPGWTQATVDCISIDSTGFLRVRVPDQFIDTSFARVMGFGQLSTNAAAIGQLAPSVPGGILPFAVLGGAGSGHWCLRSDTGNQGGGGGQGGGQGGGPGGGGPGGGAAPDPCSGPSTGNFGTIDAPLHGNTVLQTSTVCAQIAQFRVLATNIAIGFDHPVFPNNGIPSVAAARNVDVCGEEFANALSIDQGMGQGTEQGLVNGGSNDFHSPLAIPRLQNSNVGTPVVGVQLDNQPLWNFLLNDEDPIATVNGVVTVRLKYSDTIVSPHPDPGVSWAYAPAICDPDTFDNGTNDWDGDGTQDANRSWKHMHACITEYTDGSYTAQVFSSAIGGTESNPVPRFAYVPQFHQTSFPQGNSDWRDIARFRAVYLQGLWFGSGGNQTEWHPAEGGAPNSGNLRQVSAFLLPDEMLPEHLRSDPPPNTTAFYSTRLYR